MAKCEDCEEPVVWLKKPDGGWLPPVEPIFDFAYNDHYVATVDGIAQPVPQVYKKHECLTWEERQLKMLEREREKQALIEADRVRRAEAERVQRELTEARKAQEKAERELRERVEREERQHRAKMAARRREKDAERELERFRDHRFPKRLLPYACRDCGAEVNEPCRTDLWRTKAQPYLWWQREGHNSRYADAPPDDRSKIVLPVRFTDDEPWPPAQNDPGRYDMVRWLRRHYVDVFEPEKRWLTDDEQRTLTNWLLDNRGLFDEEVPHGPGGVDQDRAGAGAEGIRGRDAEVGDGEAGPSGEVLPGEPRGAGDGNQEHGDRDGGPEWPAMIWEDDDE